ncbi:MAG: hypothetical protein A2270_03725 [Elusimicrobia bacterium RIFOXYA12_FULL_51_18]|nr:MAG: hypothetical protein A2270_03725 [Elusimicrobia bacterium RIFOXYA12_FULL_51_18]OGS31952.1 MAG: hypothetical protein A2218_06690 [Elusimicrobia bacterium RIFOXYA2_FULL_53_38]
MQYLRRRRIRAYGRQTARGYAARSAPELREGENSTEFFRLSVREAEGIKKSPEISISGDFLICCA